MNQHILTSGIPVPEDALRKFSKDTGRLAPKDFTPANEEGIAKQIQHVLDVLLDTASVVDISSAHRAAACNAICALVGICQSSSFESTRNLAWSQEIWDRLFNVFLERSDNAKVKSVRQVLVCLTNILLKAPDSAPVQCSKQDVLQRLFGILFGQTDHLKVKPALQAFAHFLAKELFSVDQCLESFSNWRSNAPGNSAAVGSSRELVSLFLDRLLDWVSSHDAAPAAGNLITVLVTKGYQQKLELFNYSSTSAEPPVWVKPIEISVRQSPAAIQNLRNYVFPGLFSLELPAYLSCLKYLKLEEHLHFQSVHHADDVPSASTEEHEDVRTMLLFTALQIGKEMGLVVEADYRECKSIETGKDAIRIPDVFLGRLLTHPSSVVQLAALSLLVSSTTITRPYTGNTLRYLKRSLPFLFASTDASFRGEMLGLLQRLIDRLRAATAMMSRAVAKMSLQTARQDVPNGTVDHISDSRDWLQNLNEHSEFTKWLVAYLVTELRPTAPYQRHVSALRFLTILARSGLDDSVPPGLLSKQAQGDTKWPFYLRIFSPQLTRSLLDRVMDPFEDVRFAAAVLLKLGGAHDSQKNARMPNGHGFDKGNSDHSSTDDGSAVVDVAVVLEALKRAEITMLGSGRADHADGVARLYDILFERSNSTWVLDSGSRILASAPWWSMKLGIARSLLCHLEKTSSIATKSLTTAVGKYPLHGTLASLRYILDQPGFYSSFNTAGVTELQAWRSLHERLFSLLELVWTCVRDVLCNDAPEGHVPEEFEELDLGTKDVLSYAWRALKEASNLMRVVVIRAPFDPHAKTSMLQVADFKSLGELCFTQLAELRHRGAFSTVAQTFAACCHRCYRIDHQAVRQLPEEWYQQTLLCIRNQGSKITRRSAGIPSLMTGILVADPEGLLLAQAMSDLEAKARSGNQNMNVEQSRLPQVHAMNCLRGIFINTKLGQVSERYIADGLELGASRLESDTWAIRNCGLMLLRALIDRLLGTNDSQDQTAQERAKASRLSYDKYPKLLDIIVKPLKSKALQSSANGPDDSAILHAAVEGVFPALQILQRAPPPERRRYPIIDLVSALTGSVHWHVRDMAARTLSKLYYSPEYLGAVKAYLQSPSTGLNTLHGELLSVKYLVRAQMLAESADKKGITETMFILLVDCFERGIGLNRCPFIEAAFFDIINLLGKSLLSYPEIAAQFHNFAADVYIRYRQTLFPLPVDHRGNKAEDPALPALRKSVALCVALHLTFKNNGTQTDDDNALDNQSLKSFFTGLAQVDPDACCATLTALDETLNNCHVSITPKTMQEIYGAMTDLVSVAKDREVISSAHIVLANLVDRMGMSSLTSTPSLPLGSTGSLIHNSLGSPSLTEGALRLQGRLLDSRLEFAGGWTPEFTWDCNVLIRSIRNALHESNDFPLRYAAVQSLHGLTFFWKMQAQHTEQLTLHLNASLATYDALNDDNDDIRDIAARIVPRILASTHNRTDIKTVVPLVASQTLSKHLTQTYNTSRHLCAEALHRLIGSDVTSPNHPSVQDVLADTRKDDTTLFVQEKQNLFVDDAREAVVWSRVLKRLAPAAIPRTLAQRFAAWVIDGLATLTAVARAEHDGPLGWTAKPDVFALGMRVICGAEVLLEWSGRSRKGGVRGAEVRRALVRFVEVGRGSEVHPMWLDRIEKVLKESVLERVVVLGRRVGEVEERLIGG